MTRPENQAARDLTPAQRRALLERLRERLTRLLGAVEGQIAATNVDVTLKQDDRRAD